MKTTENIDKLIAQSLNEEEAEFYNNLEEQNLPEMITGLFQGKLRWFTILLTVIMLIIFIAGVYCAVQFFNADNTMVMMKWGLGILISFIAVAMLKTLNFIQIYSNKISRDIKRLEYQIAILSNKEKL